ncbi:type II secretion system protein [Vibrio maerlii]|uniref:type II secretion system protein n=1 Tax=Vibrio maerlii TaxID=2231648 RepID=UPI000E3E578D|nr:type II secretion system protein [Vibrio maerlii]
MSLPHSSKGFTMIELIVVIILLGIVAAVATSRYIGRDSFSAIATQDQVISVIRQVQLNRMQSNVDLGATTGNTNFTLLVQSDCVGSQSSCINRDEGRSDWVSVDNVTFSISPNNSTVNFDLLGNPIDGAINGVTITIRSSASTCLVEVNEQGYVSAGVCS